MPQMLGGGGEHFRDLRAYRSSSVVFAESFFVGNSCWCRLATSLTYFVTSLMGEKFAENDILWLVVL